jgi:hypothetical protein
MKKVVTALSMSALMTCAFPAIAADSTYSYVAAACVLTGQTSTSGTNFNSAGDATFAENKVGEIILTCPVPSSLLGASRMTIIYRDTDGQGVEAEVVANLRQKNLQTAAVSNVGVAKVSSNSQSAINTYGNMAANISPVQCGDFQFNHQANAYYVQVNLKRTSVTQKPIFATVTLSTPVC